MGLVSTSSEEGWVGQNYLGSGQDWSNLLWVWVEVVNIPSGVGGIQDCLPEWAGLVKSACESRWDRSKFLRKSLGLVRMSLGVSRIGHSFCRSR